MEGIWLALPLRDCDLGQNCRHGAGGAVGERAQHGDGFEKPRTLDN
jgi:hypothetical protein